jgi:predicted nucleic acid-binding protein
LSVFVDTSALYAFMVRTEERHADCVRALRAAVDSGRVLRTTNYVVIETVALLQHRLGLEPVRDLVDSVVPLLEVHWVDEPLHRRAMSRLLRSDKRRLSLVDCVSFEFMLSQGLREAIALDEDFATEGFRLLPPAPRRR